MGPQRLPQVFAASLTAARSAWAAARVAHSCLGGSSVQAVRSLWPFAPAPIRC